MMFTSEGKFMEHAMTVHNDQPENIEIQEAKGQLISKCPLRVFISSKRGQIKKNNGTTFLFDLFLEASAEIL